MPLSPAEELELLELEEAEYQFQKQATAKPAPEPPKGPQVYDAPVGPEQASAVDRFAERVTDPARWEAIIKGTGPYAQKSVQGTAPMVMPGGAIPKLTKAATALAEGKGIGAALGRTALSGGQGAVVSAFDSKEGESWQDKADRTKSGAKLSAGIQAAAESIPIVGKFAGAATRKLGSALSGVDESIIQNYAKRTDEVNDLIKKSGGEMPAAADAVRSELQEGIRATRANLSKQVADSIADAPMKPSISITPIVEELEKQKAKLDPIFHKEAIGQIQGFINQVKQGAVPDSVKGKAGLSNAKYLNLIKEYLQGKAASSYMQGGQIFQQSPQAAQAAKAAAAVTRKIFNQAAPQAAKANNQLSMLHSIEKNLNKNLIAPGKPDAALFAAGSGSNPRNQKMLERLGDVAGIDAIGKAKDLATAKTFANPALTPTDWTGKAAARVLAAGGIGTAVAGPVGGAIAAGLTSPMAVKAGVNLVNAGSRIASRFPSFAKFTREHPLAAQTIVQLTAKQLRDNNPPPEITPEVEEYFRGNPKLMQDVRDPKVRAELEKRVNRGPAKGESLWLERGAKNLGLNPETTARISQTKQGKQLLMDAASMPKDSKAMKRIQERLEKLK